MYCQKCGKEINDEAMVCIHCGCAIDKQTVKKSPKIENVKGVSYYNNFFKLINSLICTFFSAYGFSKVFNETKGLGLGGLFAGGIVGSMLELWLLFLILGIIGVIEAVIINIKYKNQGGK